MDTLQQEHKSAKADRREQPGSVVIADVLDSLQQLIDEYGAAATGPWLVVRTAFHGGGRISSHQTARRAIERARRESAADCTCGCAGVVPEAQFDELPDTETAKSPYDLAH